jgi:hypothetical protein
MRFDSLNKDHTDSLEYPPETTLTSDNDNEQALSDTTSVPAINSEPGTPETDAPPLIPVLAAIIVGGLVATVLILAWIKGRKRARELDVDFTQVFHDSQHMEEARLLYKELSRTIHPDRFPNEPEKIIMATERAMEIRAARHSYSELLRIQKICQSEGLL